MSAPKRVAASVIIVRPTHLHVPFRIPGVLFAIPLALAVLVFWRAMSVGPGPMQTRWLNGIPKVVLMLLLSGGAIVAILHFGIRKLNRFTYANAVPDRYVHPESALARSIAKLWRSPLRIPSADKVRAALESGGASLNNAPAFVAFGEWKPPEVEDIAFEPAVVSPGERFQKARPLLIRAAILFAVLTLAPLLVPGFSRQLRVGFLIFGIALITLLYFIWSTVIRMRYLRIAPGMIEVLHYRPLSKSPEIRTYPIAPGTLIFLNTLWGSQVVLSRGMQFDKIGLNGMSDSKEIVQKIWHAVLSTAPAPPLDRENLVG